MFFTVVNPATALCGECKPAFFYGEEGGIVIYIVVFGNFFVIFVKNSEFLLVYIYAQFACIGYLCGPGV